MAVTINSGIPTKLIITIPSKGDTNWNKIMRQAFQDIGDHDHSGIQGRGAKIQAAGLADGAIEPRHLSNDINLSALSDVQITYDPNNPSNPSLDGKLLVWDAAASKWVPTDPSSAEIGGGGAGGASTLDDTNTVANFNNGDNIGTTLTLTDQDAFVSTGGVADFTYPLGGNDPVSPDLQDVVIYADIPVKMQHGKRVTIYTDSPVEITGNARDVNIISDSTVTIGGGVTGGSIESRNLTVDNSIDNATVKVTGDISVGQTINRSDIIATGDLTTNGYIQSSNIKVKGDVNTNNENILDSNVQSEGSIYTGRGGISRSDIFAKETVTLSFLADSKLTACNLNLDYSKYDAGTTTPYTSVGLPIYNEIVNSDIFLRCDLNVINDEFNWNQGYIRGRWKQTRIFAKDAHLLLAGDSGILDCNIDVHAVSILTSVTGASTDKGFRGDTRLYSYSLLQSTSTYPLESACVLDIQRLTANNLGFNSKWTLFPVYTDRPYLIKNNTVQKNHTSTTLLAASSLNDIELVRSENQTDSINSDVSDRLRIGYIKGGNPDGMVTNTIEVARTVGHKQWINLFDTSLGANIISASYVSDKSDYYNDENTVNVPSVVYDHSTKEFVIQRTGYYNVKFGFNFFTQAKADNGTGKNTGACIRVYKNNVVQYFGESSTGNMYDGSYDWNVYNFEGVPVGMETTHHWWGISDLVRERWNPEWSRAYLPAGTRFRFEGYFITPGSDIWFSGYDISYLSFRLLDPTTVGAAFTSTTKDF